MENRIMSWIKVLMSKGYDATELVDLTMVELRDLYEEETSDNVASITTVSANGHIVIRKEVA